MTRLDYLQAAEHFETASGWVPATNHDVRGGYLNRQAYALYRHGDEKGDNAALRRAIEVYEQALVELPRERAPLQWAMTQNNLGTALATLGRRVGDPTLLSDALVAVRNAYEPAVKEAGYQQYEAYFTERLASIQADLDVVAGR